MPKNYAVLVFALSLLSRSALAFQPLPPETMDETHTFRVEVLQVTDIEPYQEAYAGFLSALQRNDVVAGKNLEVNRVKIDFDIENGGFWSRLGVLMRIRQEAARIVAAKPDLVLTIGTPATKFSRGMLADAHIPLVFTAVANPEDVGCLSLEDAGPGVTGSTLYADMGHSLKVVHDIFPHVSRIGMIHTDDENGVANVAAASSSGRAMNMNVNARLVAKTDSIIPSLKELYEDGKGVQMYAVPLDTYYGLRHYEAAIDLGDFGTEHKIPVVTLAMVRVPGAALYVGADFGMVGSLAGVQAAKILKRRVKPDVLPILRQETPTVLIDPQRVASLGVQLPQTILDHKTDGKNGYWQIELVKQ
ncbi:ABC transporter substrate-binding protein [Rugamonas apoptosis]|uniref:ABC transport system substrate-binding protein n=1 Tax=Rugamonas apoptosis TaxID=2758570 RepID=A0A7W2F8Y1_9BURK|nr:ABC transporter substrate binding protein [Rugamonas apoptosis]MBA5687252.1 hypothetical protein [Rugamonas apoptosis]